MTDCELLEQISIKVTKIDTIEYALNQIQMKLNDVKDQVIQLNKSIIANKEQNAANTELRV